uniref:Protein arginine N-methyltransferase n=1 Tax=Alona affinis TaxID=381656 RepID=A0A9N6ZEP6_9CRUS|nr:EOG090X028A [Alona affinis]
MVNIRLLQTSKSEKWQAVKNAFLLGWILRVPTILPRPLKLQRKPNWSNLIVGKLSSYIDLDHEDKLTRQQSEKILDQELSFAGHLALPAVMLPLRKKNTNLARVFHNKVVTSPANLARYHVWLHIPMVLNGLEQLEQEPQSSGESESDQDTWQWWNTFRCTANFEKRLCVALELTADLPESTAIDRWLGEPVRCLIVPTHLFQTNKKGFPVLSKPHQTVIRQFLRQKTQILITGAQRHPSYKHYQQYMDHLWQTGYDSDPLLNFAQGYEDFLQFPLQPLMDNLESQTYEVFEKDPVKYSEYQRAIYLALLDKISLEEKDTKVITLMVVGAGRGPLVRAALAAAEKADRKIRVYAVEKNPNAIVTLQCLADEEWGDSVTIVSCDMRDWVAPEKADILVSELLGSFADNELSPECLDGAQKFLKDDGISIPYSYTSFLGPIQSSKLFNEVRNCRERDKPYYTPFEMNYVVHFRNKTDLSAPKPLFTFTHPNREKPVDNSRYGALQFPIDYDAVVHGFAGYFETVLYKDVTLSINPATHSPGMFSWFPVLFPLITPVSVKKGDVLETHFWRCVNRTHVWYEWCVTKPVAGAIHNPLGRSHNIGL